MLVPFNRHLLVEPLSGAGEQEPSVVLVPDSVTLKPAYSLVKLLAVAPDCEKFNGSIGHTLLVNSNMVEEIEVEGNTYNIVLENHVVGLYASEEQRGAD